MQISTPITAPEVVLTLMETLRDTAKTQKVLDSYDTWEELVNAPTSNRIARLGNWSAIWPGPFVLSSKNALPEGIHFLTKYHTEYPTRLNNLSSPPLFLFVKGMPLNRVYVGIGGHHFPSPSGSWVAEMAVRAAQTLGVAICTTLSSGIGDLVIHSALKRNVPILAVASGGLSLPTKYTYIMNQILENNGTVVSPFLLSTTWNERGEITAGELVTGFSMPVVIPEVGTHLAGGVHFVRSSMHAFRYIIVPDPDKIILPELSSSTAALARLDNFRPGIFGTSPKIESRVTRRFTPADAVISSLPQMENAIRTACNYLPGLHNTQQ